MALDCDSVFKYKEISRDILLTVQSAVIITDPEGNILDANSKVRDVFGYTVDGLTGKSMSILFTPEDQNFLYPNLLYLANQCQVYDDEIMLLRRNQVRFFADMRMTSCRDSQTAMNIFSIIDIDKTKKMEKVFNQINYEDLVKLANGVAHEIRNPLVGIGGFLRKLYKSCVASVEDEEYYNLINSNLKKIESIVEKVEFFAGMPDPVMRKVNITDITDGVYQELASQIKSGGCALELDVEPFEFMADPEFLIRALRILVENAIESCSGIPRITIKAYAQDNVCRISVSDSGRGIAANVLPYVFHPFFSTKPDGAGIDLSILKRIVENHQGKVHVESREGEWTCFYIEIPHERRKKIRTNLLGDVQQDPEKGLS
ncbi:two-component system sensor histidine kinase NtrB [Desulfonatronovibrio magnus]|uniref:two-component system sensor histidine kinase NtrB n=1 Tax=Desulfonatronovibrio magnus TaxID=698827 RepID=UPI0005EB23FC|nr:ATP-binding protein [Desulfonatronovibrio magnus]